MENLKEVAVSSKSLDDVVVDLGTAGAAAKPAKSVKLVSHSLTKALIESGTQHIYTDTADRDELDDLLTVEETENSLKVIEEIDGNTTNQVLVAKVLDRFFRRRRGSRHCGLGKSNAGGITQPLFVRGNCLDLYHHQRSAWQKPENVLRHRQRLGNKSGASYKFGAEY